MMRVHPGPDASDAAEGEQLSSSPPSSDDDDPVADAEGGAGHGGNNEDTTGFNDAEPGPDPGESSHETIGERLGLIDDAKQFTHNYGEAVTAYHEDQLEAFATQLLRRDAVLPPELEIGFQAKETLAMEGAHITLEAQTLGPEIMSLVEDLERAGSPPAMAKLTITVTEASALPDGHPSVVASIYVQRTTPPTMLLETGTAPMAEGTASRLILATIGLHDDDMSEQENIINYPDVDDLLPRIRFFVQGFVDTLSPPYQSDIDPDDFSGLE